MKVYVLTCTVDDRIDIQVFATRELAEKERAAIEAEDTYDEDEHAIEIEENWVQGC